MRRGIITALSLVMALAPMGPALAAICSGSAEAPAHECCADQPACSTPNATAERPCCSAAPANRNMPAKHSHKSQRQEVSPKVPLENAPAVPLTDPGFQSARNIAQLFPVAQPPTISLPLRR